MTAMASEPHELELCLALADHWELYLNKDQHAYQITNALLHFAPSLDQDAQKILHLVQDLEKITQALSEEEPLLGNAAYITLLNESLHNENFTISPDSATEVAYQIQLRMIMIESILMQSCGTQTPGKDVITIRNTLQQHKARTLKGKHILELLKQRDEMRTIGAIELSSAGLDAVNLDEERRKLQNNEVQWWEKKMELLMKKAIRNALLSHFKEHSNATEEELSRAASNPLLQQRLIIELQKIQLMSRRKVPAQ